MRSWTGTAGKVTVLSLDPGEDLAEAIAARCADARLRDAVILGSVGTLDRCRIHYVATTTYPPREEFLEWHDRPLELSGISGLVVAGTPHAHITVADREQAWGGHLESGTRVLYLAEIALLAIDVAGLTRRPDDRGVVRLQ